MTESEISLSPKQREQIGRDAAAFREGINAGRATLGMTARLLMAGRITLERAIPEFDKADTLVFEAQKAGQRCIDIIGRTTDTVFHAEEDLLGMPDLSLLASMDSADMRRLCDLLEAAQVVADRIDTSRGRAVGDDVPVQPGESRGMDLGELVNNLLLRVRGEAYGGQSAHE